jgi:hypothetical protein
MQTEKCKWIFLFSKREKKRKSCFDVESKLKKQVNSVILTGSTSLVSKS